MVLALAKLQRGFVSSTVSELASDSSRLFSIGQLSQLYTTQGAFTMTRRLGLSFRVIPLLIFFTGVCPPSQATQKPLSPPSPTSRIVSAGNGYYTVSVQANPGDGVGMFTVTTGPENPDGSGRSILYGDGVPGSSFTTVRSYTSNTDYVQGQASSKTDSAAVVSFDAYGSVAAIGTNDIRTVYTLPGSGPAPDAMTIVQDVIVEGATYANSSVIVQTTITNNGSASVDVGVRYLWDYDLGDNDAPTLGPGPLSPL